MKKALALFIILGGFNLTTLEAKENTYTYIITETSVPTSYDPLDADQTQNLSAARMIYATPVEIDHQDKLSSLVLESFKYDSAKRTMEWIVKKGIVYSDGTQVTAEDIAFSVIRMAYTRPKFPVIENISGLSDWLSSKNALETSPKGIKIEGNKIEIQFSKETHHPLFRFCLELFSVIPKKCVDLKTNKITCSGIPSSGRYEMVSKTDSEILFSSRKGFSANLNTIKFKYLPTEKLDQELEKLDGNTILAANEVMLPSPTIGKMKTDGKILYLPAARFALLMLNPDVGAFKDKQCRQVFSQAFRDSFKEITGERTLSESSIFTKILSGYMTDKELKEKEFNKITNAQRESCLARFKKEKINWGYVESEKNSEFVQAVSKALSKIGLADLAPTFFKNRKDMMDAYSDGRITIVTGGSGFWAHDPSGDLQMLFTPNLHKPLNFVTRDQKLQELIRDVVASPDKKDAYRSVNQYLHDEAVVSVYTHVRRFYFSKNKSFLKNSQIGFSAPTPWQVFEL